MLIVDGTRVIEPDPPLLALRSKFTSNGEGGLIAAARSTSGFGYIDECGRWVVPPTLQDARSFTEDGVARFQSGDLWGFIDLRGKVVIEARFEDAKAFQCGRAPVKDGEYWRYIDRNGAFAFEGLFTRADKFSPCGLALARPSDEARYGYIDVAGNWAIAPQFAYALSFSPDCVAPAQAKGNRMGVIGMDGKWVVKPSYSNVGEFNHGYAYCDVNRYPRYIYPRASYIDSRGRVVIPEQEGLAKSMTDGWVKSGEGNYVGLSGELAVSAEIYWGTDFTGYGFAIASVYENDVGPDERNLTWGILAADGQFHRAPDDIIEPLTDDDTDIVFPEPDTPFAPFVTSNEDVALLDREGRIVYRLQRQAVDAGERIVLRDAGDIVLWSSPIYPSVARVRPFFGAAPARFLEEIEDPAQLPGLAEKLLERTQEKLALVARGELSCDSDDDDEDDEDDVDCGDDDDENGGDDDSDDDDDVDGDDDDGDDDGDGDDDEDEDEDDDDVESFTDPVSTAQLVWRAYLDEYSWGNYQFLETLRSKQMDVMYGRMVAVLTERFGQPASVPEYAFRSYGVSGTVWLVGSEPQRYWVRISEFADAGDGDGWYEIWLNCMPTIETMKAALAMAPANARSDGFEEVEPREPGR